MYKTGKTDYPLNIETRDTNMHPLIAAQLAKPNTHRVVTTYTNGKVREFATKSEQQAKNHAVLDQRNIGRNLIDRETNQTVCIMKVEVKKI